MENTLLTSRKYKLIQDIISLEDETEISKLEKQVATLHQRDKFREAVKPICQAVSLEQMMAEQQYQPVQKEVFFRKANKLKIEESLEDLLSMLDERIA